MYRICLALVAAALLVGYDSEAKGCDQFGAQFAPVYAQPQFAVAAPVASYGYAAQAQVFAAPVVPQAQYFAAPQVPVAVAQYGAVAFAPRAVYGAQVTVAAAPVVVKQRVRVLRRPFAAFGRRAAVGVGVAVATPY